MKVILDLGDGIDKELNKLVGKFINPLVAEAKVIHIVNAYRDWETDRKSTRLNSSHSGESRMPSSA